ncbi:MULTISPECIES: ABC transporter ATP-binding protein [unclassified Beijerinckia]|uniref:ABC transporter ATP-binding protein n=1 Tax=unclassified Beijerinckia TaxID=2638183 RepID=UPI00089BC10A|nr:MULTISPECIES: ABC transporter ATP-binding protein [unclassified Beijerinckia]MDH7799300.1 NitT/TauT family transport system ATP-binding protein [Beijerinckia sp. GAS462]SED45433.1 NitT/TauT family transport system ATP-binding protein [Beijerinckia sp. 28-YEA-48]
MEAINPADAAIDIRGLRLSFLQDGEQTEVLRDLNLTVPHGSFVVLVGASGVGKSTLLRVLMGLAKPSAGSVAVHPDPKAERPMALVFQDSRLLPWRRVVRNVEFGLEKTSLLRAERRARALEVLALVGLEELADRWPWQLSGGQRQRVALARALAVRPSILLMDEPFSALDIATREGLQDQLIQIWQKMNKTILFVTHDIDEAAYLADRIVALAGKPGEIRADRVVTVARPRARNSRSLAEIVALVRADITGEAVSADNWEI